MSEIPKISEAEWEVMKIFWAKAVPCTANEIVAALSGFADWKPNTVKTLITRLVKKGALGFREERRIYRYYPLATEDQRQVGDPILSETGFRRGAKAHVGYLPSGRKAFPGRN